MITSNFFRMSVLLFTCFLARLPLFSQTGNEELNPLPSFQTNPETIIGYQVPPNEHYVIRQVVLTFHQDAQVFIELNSSNYNGMQLIVSNEKTKRKFLVSGNKVLCTLPLHETFTCTVEGHATPLTQFDTHSYEVGTGLEVPEDVFNFLTFNESLRENATNIIQAMDESVLTYFDKLRLVQCHFMQGKPLPEDMKISTEGFLSMNINQSIEKRLRYGRKDGDDLFELPFDDNWWVNNADDLAGEINCKSTLLIKSTGYTSNPNSGGIQLESTPYYYKKYMYPNHNQSILSINNNYDWDYNSYLKGAAVNKVLHAHSYHAHAPEEQQQNDFDLNTQFLAYNNLATGGFFFKSNCGCIKRVNTHVEYFTEVGVGCSVYSGSNPKHAMAKSNDEAVASLVRIAGANAGEVFAIGGGIADAVRNVDVQLNPDWTKTLSEVATGTISTIVAALTASGGGSQAVASVLGSTGATSLTTGLVGLFTTPMNIYNNSSGASYDKHKLIDAYKEFDMQPNEGYMILLSSKQRMMVATKRHSESTASIRSHGFIASYLYPVGTPIQGMNEPCCTREFGNYIQAGITNTDEIANRDKLGVYFWLNGIEWSAPFCFPGTTTPSLFGNYSWMKGWYPPGCDTIKHNSNRHGIRTQDSIQIFYQQGAVAARLPMEWLQSSFEIIDLQGRKVYQGKVLSTEMSLSPYVSNPGIYFLNVFGKNKNKSIKFVVL
jgi:hypothetical protein